jgi:hypothetical protein
MKTGLILVLSLFLLQASAAAFPLCDYRSPRTDLTDLGMSFSYRYQNDPYGLSERDVNEGQLKVNYRRLFDSPDFGFDLEVKNDMTISLLGLSSFLATAEGNFKRYFSPDAPYFGFAGLTGKSASSYVTIGISVALGVGYGRFVNATPLAKAIKIDAHLVAQHSISENLSRADLESIAYEIDNVATYASLAELLAALQEIIEGSGLTKMGGLDALDLSQMGELVEDNSYSRYCGGDLKLGLGYEVLDPMGAPNDLLATIAFDYAFTTTPEVQFLTRGSLSGSYDILHTYRLEVTASYDYLITDFVSLLASYTFSREMWDGAPTDLHQFSLDLVLTPVAGSRVSLGIRLEHLPYYLEWKKDITLLMSIDLL